MNALAVKRLMSGTYHGPGCWSLGTALLYCTVLALCWHWHGRLKCPKRFLYSWAIDSDEMTRIVQSCLGVSPRSLRVPSLGFLTVWCFHNFLYVGMLSPEHEGEHYHDSLERGPERSRGPISFGSTGHSSHRGGSDSKGDELDVTCSLENVMLTLPKKRVEWKSLLCHFRKHDLPNPLKWTAMEDEKSQ